MPTFARSVLFAAMLTGIAGPALVASPALAQAIPPGQSCGGLLCDMGVFGHKVTPGPTGEPATPQQVQEQLAAAEAADPHRLPCHDFICRAMGQKDADAAPPPAPAPVAAVEPPPPAKQARKAKRRHVAKAEAPAPETPPAAAK